MRPGDLDVLKEKLKNGLENARNAEKENYAKIFEVFIDWVDREPTIDAVPVVRCQECRKWDVDPDSYGKDDGPKGRCMKSFEETYDNDFCSYGQRKETNHA